MHGSMNVKCKDAYMKYVTGRYLCIGLERPLEIQEVKALRFQYNQHMKVVILSALRTGHLYLPGNIPGTHFL